MSETFEPGGDREQIETFLLELEDLLRDALHGPEAGALFRSDLLEELRGAWEEMPALFGEARADLMSPEREPEVVAGLRRVRLFGRQLAMKIGGWKTSSAAFLRDKTGRLLSAALGWGDVILGSLAGVVGAAEGIKEFKEAVEAAHDTTEALGQSGT